jgi:UrcA family protein
MIVRSFPPRLAVLAAVAALASPALLPGAAQAAEPTPSRIVQYGDLNLSTPAGQRALQQRIQGAARQVCAPLDGQSLREQRGWRDCMAQAIGGAQAAVSALPLAVRAAAAAAIAAR